VYRRLWHGHLQCHAGPFCGNSVEQHRLGLPLRDRVQRLHQAQQSCPISHAKIGYHGHGAFAAVALEPLLEAGCHSHQPPRLAGSGRGGFLLLRQWPLLLVGLSVLGRVFEAQSPVLVLVILSNLALRLGGGVVSCPALFGSQSSRVLPEVRSQPAGSRHEPLRLLE